jgi:hypothetical protein
VVSRQLGEFLTNFLASLRNAIPPEMRAASVPLADNPDPYFTLRRRVRYTPSPWTYLGEPTTFRTHEFRGAMSHRWECFQWTYNECKALLISQLLITYIRNIGFGTSRAISSRMQSTRSSIESKEASNHAAQKTSRLIANTFSRAPSVDCATESRLKTLFRKPFWRLLKTLEDALVTLPRKPG